MRQLSAARCRRDPYAALRQARRTAPPRRKPLPAPALLRMAKHCQLVGLRLR